MDIFMEPPSVNEYNIEYAVACLKQAKHDEDGAKSLRIKWEELIAAKIPGPEIGSKTITLDDGTKITVKRGYNYKADCQGILDLACKLELEHTPVKQKSTYELDEKGYNWYMQNDIQVFDLLSQYVTVTPKKVAIEIKQK